MSFVMLLFILEACTSVITQCSYFILSDKNIPIQKAKAPSKVTSLFSTPGNMDFVCLYHNNVPVQHMQAI